MKYTQPKYIPLYDSGFTPELEEEITAADALPCPFCGGPAIAAHKWIYVTPAMYIMCQACGNQTAHVRTGTDFGGRETTMPQAFRKALATWNTRRGG